MGGLTRSVGPPTFKYMLSRHDKREAMKRVEELQRNPPKVLPQHIEGAKQLLEQNKKFEAEKDRDIKRELQGLSKDCASFVHNRVNGVGQLFHGFGQGKRVLCSICEQHDSSMFNMNDGQWYCAEHRWFGNLTDEQKERERTCLSSKDTKQTMAQK